MINLNSKKLFFVLIVLVVASSGCISKNSSELAKVDDNPEKFLNQTVELQGSLAVRGGYPEGGPIEGYFIGANSNHQMDVQIETNSCRELDTGSNVTVKGEINSFETCNCNGTKTLTSWSSSEGETTHEIRGKTSSNEVMAVDRCEKITKSRETINEPEDIESSKAPKTRYNGCIEGAKEMEYYLTCSEVK